MFSLELSFLVYGLLFTWVCAVFTAIALVITCLLALFANSSSSSKNEDAKKEKRRLVVLDLNNVLVYRAWKNGLDESDKDPRIKGMLDSAFSIGNYWVWNRPGIQVFIAYCMEHFDVAVWSSAQQKNVDALCLHVFGRETRAKLAFEWDQTQCRVMSLPGGGEKPLFQKPLAHIVQAFPGKWAIQDILMIDDSIAKMAPNPEGSFLVAPSWTPLFPKDDMSNSLTPGGVIWQRLEQFRSNGTGCLQL